MAVDAVWFGGANKDGVYLIISGARRQDRLVIFKELGERIGWFYSRS